MRFLNAVFISIALVAVTGAATTPDMAARSVKRDVSVKAGLSALQRVSQYGLERCTVADARCFLRPTIDSLSCATSTRTARPASAPIAHATLLAQPAVIVTLVAAEQVTQTRTSARVAQTQEAVLNLEGHHLSCSNTFTSTSGKYSPGVFPSHPYSTSYRYPLRLGYGLAINSVAPCSWVPSRGSAPRLC